VVWVVVGVSAASPCVAEDGDTLFHWCENLPDAAMSGDRTAEAVAVQDQRAAGGVVRRGPLLTRRAASRNRGHFLPAFSRLAATVLVRFDATKRQSAA
jgi:hypothetical protein